jgi:hypothetical protein
VRKSAREVGVWPKTVRYWRKRWREVDDKCVVCERLAARLRPCKPHRYPRTCCQRRDQARGQPVTDAMGLEVCLFFKKRPTERCEMFGTRPRRMASSAISRWLHWLIGRSLSDGFSHVIATTAQICSGVYVAGAPDRGASG